MPGVATLHVTGLAKSHGADVLFRDVSFRVPPGQRLALVGRNGSGKTTLLRMLAGEVGIDEGEIGFPRSARIALHDQRPPRTSGKTLAGYVGESLADLHETEERLADLERRMAAGDHDDETLRAYAAAQAELEHAGGYQWRSRLESILRGLGFADADADRDLRTFSGGELTRASLARALAMRPDLLLLDEPTNHLDLQSLEWLERELQSLDCSVVLVSHDRWFLEAVATGVAELEGGRARVFEGRYSAFRREKALAIAQQAEAYERQQEELARLQRFVDKFRAGTRSRQAASRAKQIERIEMVDRPRQQRALAFGFPKTVRPGRDVMEVEHARVEAGDKLLVRDGSFAIERGQRVALIGPNGAGKTSLVESLLGARRIAAGRVKLGHNVSVAYFTQHEEELPASSTVLEAMTAATPLNQNQARTLLGRFLFSGDTVERKVSVLSGGERRRLSLAKLVSSGANFLVLDEPTNHLDIESREALEDAIEAYDGTVLFVSHDRALIDAVATHTLALEEQALTLRLGDYNDYVVARDQLTALPPPPKPAKAAAPAPTAKPKPAAAPAAPKPARPPQRVQRKLADLEARIADREAEIGRLESELADPAVIADYELLATVAEKHRATQEELAWLYREWETVADSAGV
jgi:ATP-binding cassette subfamily F protein 3